MLRRCNRFLDLLNVTDKEIIFIRNGHSVHHHNESEQYECTIKNDIDDSNDLYNHLKEVYSNLNFKIVCFIRCGICYNSSDIHCNNITVYNIASTENTDAAFEVSFNKALQTFNA